MRLRSWALGAAAVLVGAGVLAYALVPGVRWRTDLVAITATGQIEGIELSDVIHMIAPGSAVSLKGLVESRNPYRSIENPFGSAEDIAAGSQAYDRDCAKCHGESGKGATAPALNRQNLVHGDSDWSLFNTIRYGVDGSAMLAANLEEREIWSVVAYLASVRSGAEEQRLATNRIDFDPVSSEALENGRSTPQDWLTYSGAYDSQRYSELDSIHSDNASRAHIAWVHQFDGAATMHEPSPVVVAGVMYLTESPNTVHALDAQSGKRLWSYSHRNADDIAVCCGAVNRGLAIHGHTLYMGTLDSNLVALDARTGKHLWTSDLHDHRLGSSITAAPLVVGDKVIVGYGGGDMGVRSFLDAVNTSDGSLAWRFFTIPAEGEPGNETWSGDSWKTGGAATWLTGSYDPENRLLYWTTGNPAPDFQGDLREGDNLYSCSVVAINIDTGELAWHFQFTPHDEHDWDANQIPVLADRMWNGEMRRLLLLANRNGFFYVLDRDTGEFLLAE
ncbi:MAG: PQQ-binding-like beta-propeller repeat protein, partial [Pseudomonadota bacterium]